MPQTILDHSDKPGTVSEEVDFQALHTIAKSLIYLTEGAEAAVLTAQAMLDSGLFAALHGLRYQKGLLQSTQLRLQSLEKRMTNIINLVRTST